MPKLECGVSFAVGMVSGALCFGAFAFGSGWAMSPEAMDSKINDISNMVQSAFCATRAEDFLYASHDVKGASGAPPLTKKERQELAERFALALPGQKTPAPIVIEGCARLLRGAFN